MRFDLTDEPWIPCERLDGAELLLSTRDVLARAHELRSIVDPDPLVTGALHRHLLAVLHRVVDGPADLGAWVELHARGSFDRGSVDRYLSRVRDRMDLFHPVHPFAQARGLIQQFGATPIDEMTVCRRSWGTGRALFQHRHPSHRPTMTPAEAARALVTYHCFDAGGLVKKPGEPTSATSSPFVGPALFLARADTLFGTLVANLLVYSPHHGLPVAGTADDAPSWEQDPPPSRLPLKKEPKRMPHGWLDRLTWLSRRIELVEEGGLVTGFVRCVYQGIVPTAPPDPMAAWRPHDKRGWVPITLRPERAFWRDSGALFEASDVAGHRQRPKSLDQIASLQILGALAPEAVFAIDVHGVAADKSRIDLSRRESVHAFARLLADPDVAEDVAHALSFAETTIKLLGGALFVYARHGLSPGERQPDTGDVRATVNALGAVPAAWSALQVAFDDFLRALSDPDAARHAFEASCVTTVRKLFETATASGDRSARWLKAEALASRKLRVELAALDRTEAPHPKEMSA